MAAHEAYETLRSRGGRHGASLDAQSAATTSAKMRAESRGLVVGVAGCFVGVEQCAAAAATEAGDFAAARAVVESLRRKIASWNADITSLRDDETTEAAAAAAAEKEEAKRVVVAGGRAAEGGVSTEDAAAAAAAAAAARKTAPSHANRFKELPPSIRAAADRAAMALEAAAAAAAAKARACLADADVEGAATQAGEGK